MCTFRLLFVGLVVHACIGILVDGATYYVATTGKNTNVGSQAQPWLTVQKAANVAVAGDTVNIASGNYAEDVQFTKSGSATSPITFTGPSTVNVRSMVLSGNYLTISRISVGNGNTVNHAPGGVAISISGNENLVDSVVMDLQSPGTPAAPMSSGIAIDGANNIVQNCDISHTAGGSGALMTGGSSKNNLIFNNKIHDTIDGDAIRFWGDSNVFRANEIYGLTNPNYGTTGVDHCDFIQTYGPPSGGGFDTCTNNLFEQNFVHDCDSQIGNLDTPGSHFTGNTLRNNVFANIGSSLFVGIPGMKFYNNVFYNAGVNQLAALNFYGGTIDDNSDNATVINNAFIGYGFGSHNGNFDTFTLDHNYFGRLNTYAPMDTDYVGGTNVINGGNPNFVNITARNFHLKAGSVFLGNALVLSNLFNNDKDGAIRGGIWDLGAYQLSTGNPVAPVAPAGLSTVSVGNTNAHIQWTMSGSNQNGFYLYRSLGNGTYSLIATLTALTLTYSDSNGEVGLVPNTQYCYVVKAYNSVGVSPASNTDCLMTTSSSQTESIFSTQVPTSLINTDGLGVNYELGMRFYSKVAGKITSVRFYKSSSESGTHTGRIFLATSKVQLTSIIFTSESASGWQVQALTTPLTITANTEYVVSVNTGNTYYVATTSGLSSSITNGDLVTSTGLNGVYGSVGAYPVNSFSYSNYFRDIVFSPNPVVVRQSLFAASSAPTLLNQNDGIDYELGMRFTSTVAGQITAIRFYKTSNEVFAEGQGVHYGRIFLSSTGVQLGSVIFSGETNSGWQQQPLTTPISMIANTEYIVTVNSGNKYYGATNSGLATQVTSTNLRSVVGNNGIFGTVLGSAPTSTFQNTNYYRDIVFVAS